MMTRNELTIAVYLRQDLSDRANACLEAFVEWLHDVTIERPVHSRVIEERFGLSGVEVRQMVHVLVVSGYPVGSDARGYWWARTPEELEPAVRQIENRHRALAMRLHGYDLAKARLRSTVRHVEQTRLL